MREYCIKMKDPEFQSNKVQLRALLPIAFPRKTADLDSSNAMRNYWCLVSCAFAVNEETCLERLKAVSKTTDRLKTRYDKRHPPPHTCTFDTICASVLFVLVPWRWFSCSFRIRYCLFYPFSSLAKLFGTLSLVIHVSSLTSQDLIDPFYLLDKGSVPNGCHIDRDMK